MAMTTTPVSTVPAVVPTPNIAGNWQFSTASTVPGTPPVTIAGNISQDGSVVGGALHVTGSNCVDPLTAMSLTGNVNSDSASLTATGTDGQAVTLTGTFMGSGNFAGTYTIKGACATGQGGSVTGISIPGISDLYSGTFASSTQKTFTVWTEISQSGSASSPGSFELSGTASFDTPCFAAGTLKPGALPSGSFILGTSVTLEFDTGNGTLTFVGTLNGNENDSNIVGNYTISGGTCNDSGTAVLIVESVWDY